MIVGDVVCNDNVGLQQGAAVSSVNS